MNPLRSALRRPLPPRVAIVQAELDRFRRPHYLEIGVHTGVLFLHLRAARKVGVDPAPAVPAWKRALHPYTLLRSEVVVATSDAYFGRLAPGERFDVVFVDGHHTYAQALRDVENALAHLSADGVVLVHDCDPPTAAAASRDPAATAGGPWCGDVWKAIVLLRALRDDLHVDTLATDCGIATIRRGGDGGALDLDEATIDGMTYADLEADRERLLGLRPAGQRMSSSSALR